jgi:membrane-associated protease RseP (regulator of RpoE activity)
MVSGVPLLMVYVAVASAGPLNVILVLLYAHMVVVPLMVPGSAPTVTVAVAELAQPVAASVAVSVNTVVVLIGLAVGDAAVELLRVPDGDHE